MGAYYFFNSGNVNQLFSRVNNDNGNGLLPQNNFPNPGCTTNMCLTIKQNLLFVDNSNEARDRNLRRRTSEFRDYL